MANLLQNLKADGPETYKKYVGHDSESEEDEDITTIVQRRQSMNMVNEVGMNFHKYQEAKPAAGVRREILNMFNEYKDSENKEHARDELISICEQYNIQKYIFVGYFINNSLAEKPDDFRQYTNLVYEYFFKDQKLIDGKELLER